MVEKITIYKYVCDLCGATIQNADGSLPDGWKRGYNRDVQVCSKCSQNVYVDEIDDAIQTIRRFCKSRGCTDCPLCCRFDASCKLNYKPVGYNWANALNTLACINDNDSEHTYDDLIDAIKVLKEHCAGRACTDCRLRRKDLCEFEISNPDKWEEIDNV